VQFRLQEGGDSPIRSSENRITVRRGDSPICSSENRITIAGKRNHAAVVPQAEKHPDSGKLEILRNQMVITLRSGDQKSMPVTKVKELLPPNMAGKCLHVACSNQTGQARMRHCPHKTTPGHKNMSDSAHSHIPAEIARRFFEGAKPFRAA
jgi:hypothetical protein